jgi:hypothetical protein
MYLNKQVVEAKLYEIDPCTTMSLPLFQIPPNWGSAWPLAATVSCP